MAVPELAWYFRMRMGWGTGSSPTRVPCCRNRRISDSSVRPLSGMGCLQHAHVESPPCRSRGAGGSPWTRKTRVPVIPPPEPALAPPQSPLSPQPHPHPPEPHLSMQIFSTWGTSTCSSRMMVCSGSFAFQERTWGEEGGRAPGAGEPDPDPDPERQAPQGQACPRSHSKAWTGHAPEQ